MTVSSFSDIIEIISSNKEQITSELAHYIGTHSDNKKINVITIYDNEKNYINKDVKFITKIPNDVIRQYNTIYLISICENVVTNMNEFMYKETTEERLIYTIKTGNLVCVYTDSAIKNLQPSDTIMCKKNIKMRMFNMSSDSAYFMILDR